jgi:hypothetical protein
VSRIRKALAGLVVIIVSVAAAAFAGAAPAQAASWTDCPSSDSNWSGYVCLWENAGYTGGRWQAAKSVLEDGLSGGVDGCYNLNGSSYTNGHAVRDTASSWAIRTAQDNYPGGWNYKVYFFEWINCNWDGNYRFYTGNNNYAVSDLSTLTPNWDNTVASILVAT